MLTISRPVDALKPCNGDWLQRGCATGTPSVHRVTTHNVTRDVCAYHSPFDVSEARPAGVEILAVEFPPAVDNGHGDHGPREMTVNGVTYCRGCSLPVPCLLSCSAAMDACVAGECDCEGGAL